LTIESIVLPVESQGDTSHLIFNTFFTKTDSSPVYWKPYYFSGGSMRDKENQLLLCENKTVM
jgi:hypothetical protein